MHGHSKLTEQEALTQIEQLQAHIESIKRARITLNDIVPFAVFESSYNAILKQDLYILIPTPEGKFHLSGNHRKIDSMWDEGLGARDDVAMLELMHRLKAVKTNMTLGIIDHESV